MSVPYPVLHPRHKSSNAWCCAADGGLMSGESFRESAICGTARRVHVNGEAMHQLRCACLWVCA